MKKSDNFDSLLAIGVAGLAALWLSTRNNSEDGGGSDFGNPGSAPFSAIPIETGTPRPFVYTPEKLVSLFSKKEVSSGQFTSPISGMEASSIYYLSDAGIAASAIEKKTGAYPLSAFSSPSRDQMAAEYLARVANYEATKKTGSSDSKKTTKISSMNYSSQGGGNYSGGWS